MFFRNRRLNNVASDNDGTLEIQLRILGMSSVCGQQLRHGLTALQDDYPFSGSLYAIEDSQAAGLEVGCVDGFHMTSVGDQSDRVKPNGSIPTKMRYSFRTFLVEGHSCGPLLLLVQRVKEG